MRLGKQRQEEMKSLIQNSLRLGEKPQTTEASKFKNKTHQKKHQNNNVFDAFCHCLFLRTSYNNLNKISIENFREIHRIFEEISANSVRRTEKHCQRLGFLIP